MKKLLFVVACLVLIASVGFSQGFTNGKLLHTYTAMLASSDDTTGYITMSPKNIMEGRYVALLWRSTDSVQAAVYIIGSNSKVSTGTGNIITYVDSISTILWAVNGHTALGLAPYVKCIVIRGPGVDRIPGCDRFKVGTVFTAATTDRAAAKGYWYLQWIP